MRQKKSLGQIFIKDQNIIRKIIKTADISSKDNIVEVGCGDGWFSLAIAEKAKALHIIEIDSRFLVQTQLRLKDLTTISYELADILKDEFGSVPFKSYRVIANIPYYLSAKFMQLLVKKREFIQSAYIMVQDEFAKKCKAKPGMGDYTSLTIYTSFYYEISYEFKVKRTCFRPIPKVDSAIIKLTPKSTLLNVDEELFFTIVRTAFWARRKTLLNTLLKGPYLECDPSIKEIEFFQKDSEIRGEVLGLEDYYELYTQLKSIIKLKKDKTKIKLKKIKSIT